MSYFSYRFYTDDFDQEMLDFVEKKYGLSKSHQSVKDDYLNYGTGNNYFWTCNGASNVYDFHKLTKREFKEIVGMSDKKTFTKADLVAGKHVVELADGSRYTLVNLLGEVVGFNLQAEQKGFHNTWYQSLREDMTYPYNKDHTVIAVYEATGIDVYYSCSNHNLNLVWKRPPAKTQTEIELEKLQQQIADLQAQANKLQQTL
jgi:hypothetical protein